MVFDGDVRSASAPGEFNGTATCVVSGNMVTITATPNYDINGFGITVHTVSEGTRVSSITVTST